MTFAPTTLAASTFRPSLLRSGLFVIWRGSKLSLAFRQRRHPLKQTFPQPQIPRGRQRPVEIYLSVQRDSALYTHLTPAPDAASRS